MNIPAIDYHRTPLNSPSGRIAGDPIIDRGNHSGWKLSANDRRNIKAVRLQEKRDQQSRLAQAAAHIRETL